MYQLIKAVNDDSDAAHARATFEQMLADESFTINRAFKRFIQAIQDDIPNELIKKIIEEKDLKSFLNFISDYVDEFADELPKSFVRAAQSEVERLSQPGVFGIGKLDMEFDPGAQSASEIMQASKLKFIKDFTANQRDAVRTAIADSLDAGEGPAASARAFRDAIGLTESQVKAVNNYQRLLENGSSQALDRQLRDARFDRTVARVIEDDDLLSGKQIERMVGRYAENMRNFRAMTIARTETMRALNQAKQEAWAQIADELNLDPDEDVERMWVATLDDRVRETHHDMHRQVVVGMDTPFESPSGEELLYPGDPAASPEETINCRCTLVVKFIPPIKKAGFDPDEPRDKDGKWTDQEWSGVTGPLDPAHQHFRIYIDHGYGTRRLGNDYYTIIGAKNLKAAREAWKKIGSPSQTDSFRLERIKKAGFDPDEPRDDHGRWVAMFHGSPRKFDSFKGKYAFFTNNESVAEQYSRGGILGAGNTPIGEHTPTVYRVKVDPGKTFDLRNPDHKAIYNDIRSKHNAAVTDPDERLPSLKSEGFIQGSGLPGFGHATAILEHASGHGFSSMAVDEGSQGPSLLVRHPSERTKIVKAGFDPDEPRDDHGRWTNKNELPDEPGTVPIPEGHVRLYHQASEDATEEIRASGNISLSRARGIEGPRAIYADERGFYGKPGEVPTVEFHVPRERWDPPFVRADSVLDKGRVGPESIIAVHLPWHHHARYIENNDRVKSAVLAGEHDSLLTDKQYGPAIKYIKSKYGSVTKAGFDPDEPRDEKGQWTEDGATKEDKKKKTQEDLDKLISFGQGHSAIGTPELAEELTNRDVTADEFVSGLFPKLRESPTGMIRGDLRFGFRGVLAAEDGSKLGIAERTIDFKHNEVTHDYFSLGKTGTGKAKEILDSQVKLYKKLGLNEVKTNANIEVGGYAWAKYGFLPDKMGWKLLQKELKTNLDELSNLDPLTHQGLDQLIKSNNPKALWAISDSTHGKQLLMGTDWYGSLKLHDTDSMNRFNSYIGKR